MGSLVSACKQERAQSAKTCTGAVARFLADFAVQVWVDYVVKSAVSLSHLVSENDSSGITIGTKIIVDPKNVVRNSLLKNY